MAKNQNTFEKRRREHEKRQRSAEKLARRRERQELRKSGKLSPAIAPDAAESPDAAD